jgi:hypothetical protein
LRESRVIAGVMVAVLGTTTLKLWISAHTLGQEDVLIWRWFSDRVNEVGAIHVYQYIPFNHPPLDPWLLMAMSHGSEWISFPFLVRAPAALCDAVTILLVFHILRRRTTIRRAALSALLLAVSPILIVESGFQGNWDALFLCSLISCLYFLTIRQNPKLAGLIFGLGISIKILPIVALPALLVYSWRRSASSFVGFIWGGAVVFLSLWLPVLIVHPRAFVTHVLGYSGANSPRQWGWVQFAKWFDVGGHVLELLINPGRFLLVVVCAFVGALIVWRNEKLVFEAVGTSLILLLITLPAWGPQYLVWPIAFGYLISPLLSSVYQFCASVFVLVIFSRWTGAPPWDWFAAATKPLNGGELVLMALTWASLAGLGLSCIRYLGRMRHGPDIAEIRTADLSGSSVETGLRQ